MSLSCWGIHTRPCPRRWVIRVIPPPTPPPLPRRTKATRVQSGQRKRLCCKAISKSTVLFLPILMVPNNFHAVPCHHFMPFLPKISCHFSQHFHAILSQHFHAVSFQYFIFFPIFDDIFMLYFHANFMLYFHAISSKHFMPFSSQCFVPFLSSTFHARFHAISCRFILRIHAISCLRRFPPDYSCYFIPVTFPYAKFIHAVVMPFHACEFSICEVHSCRVHADDSCNFIHFCFHAKYLVHANFA